MRKNVVGLLCGMTFVALAAALSSWLSAAATALALLILEALAFLLVRHLRGGFPWLITTRDVAPDLSPEGLAKFIRHGYDPQLGWVRKPGTANVERGRGGATSYHIDAAGSRSSPGHEGWPQYVSFYGDSFTFGRQVNDDETFTWHLSEMTGSHAMNFAVGNYGLDQAFLRLQREYPRHPTPIVVIGVVPSTIVRVLSVWKHYNEYGNTFAFKPRFLLRSGELSLIPNFIDEEAKFSSYRRYLPDIQRHDPFYEMKFKKDLLCFPFLASILADPARNIPLLALVAWDRWLGRSTGTDEYPMPMKLIMDANLRLRVDLYRNHAEAVELLAALVAAFAAYGQAHRFRPVLLWTPQKDDVLYVGRRGNYYSEFLAGARLRMPVVDLTPDLLRVSDLDQMYSDDTQYGGHLSPAGNRWAAVVIHEYMVREGCFDGRPSAEEGSR